MSAGIYMCNGRLAYTKNLEKKISKRKNAIIIEKYEGPEDDNLEKELQLLLDKHLKITNTEEKIEQRPLKYCWVNKINGHTIYSIYPHLNNIPDINKDEWIQKKGGE